MSKAQSSNNASINKSLVALGAVQSSPPVEEYGVAGRWSFFIMFSYYSKTTPSAFGVSSCGITGGTPTRGNLCGIDTKNDALLRRILCADAVHIFLHRLLKIIFQKLKIFPNVCCLQIGQRGLRSLIYSRRASKFPYLV